MTSSSICQIDTVSKVAVNRQHVLLLIQDAERGDALKAELDTVLWMYHDLNEKSILQDSIIVQQKRNLKLCMDGWDDCENIVERQRQDMEEFKAKEKSIKTIGKAVILALLAALIIK